jgi:hypothetical protein
VLPVSPVPAALTTPIRAPATKPTVPTAPKRTITTEMKDRAKRRLETETPPTPTPLDFTVPFTTPKVSSTPPVVKRTPKSYKSFRGKPLTRAQARELERLGVRVFPQKPLSPKTAKRMYESRLKKYPDSEFMVRAQIYGPPSMVHPQLFPDEHEQKYESQSPGIRPQFKSKSFTQPEVSSKITPQVKLKVKAKLKKKAFK